MLADPYPRCHDNDQSGAAMWGSILGFPRNMALSEGRERGGNRPHTYEMRIGERAVPSQTSYSSLRSGGRGNTIIERLGGEGLHAMERSDWSI